MVGGDGGVEWPLERRTAIHCGASKGLGRETARRFAGLGGSVCTLARLCLKEFRNSMEANYFG